MIKKILLLILHMFIASVGYSFTGMQKAFGQQLPGAGQAAPSEAGQYKSIPADAGEKYLILNKAPWIGKFRRYRFAVGQQLNFKVKNDKKRFKAEILGITDSSFTITGNLNGINGPKEVMLNDLRQFKVSRRIPLVSEAAYYFPIGGLLYIGADFFNKGLDDKRFTTDASALFIGGTLILAGLICHQLSSHTIKVNARNTLSVTAGY